MADRNSWSWFQITGAWQEKERWPRDFVRKDGILNCRVSVEERSCWEGVECFHLWPQAWKVFPFETARQLTDGDSLLAPCVFSCVHRHGKIFPFDTVRQPTGVHYWHRTFHVWPQAQESDPSDTVRQLTWIHYWHRAFSYVATGTGTCSHLTRWDNGCSLLAPWAQCSQVIVVTGTG